MEQSQKYAKQIAMDEGQSLFSMTMRLEIPKEITTNTKSCYDYAAAIMKDENDKQTKPSWMDSDLPTTVTSTENNQNRKRRFLPLLLGIGAVASAILSAGTAIYVYISEQLMQIKRQMTKIDTHLASLTDKITEQHDQLVTITKATNSLYENTHTNYRMLTEQLTQLQCKEHQEFEVCTRRSNMKARLYADFESTITAAFSGHPTPILLPPSGI